MKDVKGVTRRKLLQLYKEQGYRVAVEVARGILGKGTNRVLKDATEKQKAEFKTSLNGELGETVLEIAVLEYCKKHPSKTKDWFYTKSMIIRDPDNPSSEFLTELDFTLFTPQCVYLFECKSYAGEKSLEGKGVLVRSNANSCDVFSQSYLHVKVLSKNIDGYASKPSYRMVMFNFSDGTLSDLRSKKAKFYLPCVDETDWTSVLVENTQAVWHMERLHKAIAKIDSCSDSLRKQHLEYVKGLHGNRR